MIDVKNLTNLRKLCLDFTIVTVFIVPSNLEILKLGENFIGNFMLKEDSLLETLIMHDSQNLPLDGKLVKTKLKKLQLSDSFNNSVRGELPESLEYLELEHGFKNILTDNLPKNLKYLSFNGGCFVHNLTKISNVEYIYVNQEALDIYWDESYSGEFIVDCF